MGDVQDSIPDPPPVPGWSLLTVIEVGRVSIERDSERAGRM